MCRTSSELNVMLHFYNFGAFFTYINTKTVAEQLQGA